MQACTVYKAAGEVFLYPVCFRRGTPLACPFIVGRRTFKWARQRRAPASKVTMRFLSLLGMTEGARLRTIATLFLAIFLSPLPSVHASYETNDLVFLTSTLDPDTQMPLEVSSKDRKSVV